jgi:hypothetical protein
MDINWREGEPLEPVDEVIASRVAKLFQCLPEGRLEVVDVGEKGEWGPRWEGSSSGERDFSL